MSGSNGESGKAREGGRRGGGGATKDGPGDASDAGIGGGSTGANAAAGGGGGKVGRLPDEAGGASDEYGAVDAGRRESDGAACVEAARGLRLRATVGASSSSS